MILNDKFGTQEKPLENITFKKTPATRAIRQKKFKLYTFSPRTFFLFGLTDYA